MQIVRRHRIRNDISLLTLFATVANNDMTLLGTKEVKTTVEKYGGQYLYL